MKVILIKFQYEFSNHEKTICAATSLKAAENFVLELKHCCTIYQHGNFIFEEIKLIEEE